jgi:hypothetical protein
MARQILGPMDVRRAWNLPFCYLCGGTEFDLDGAQKRTRDHCPPNAPIELVDRKMPLILPAHRRCNSGHSADDEVIGQLISLLHRVPPSEKPEKLDMRLGSTPDGRPVPAVVISNLDAIIMQWVRGFHAALYEEYLPPQRPDLISLPLPEGRLAMREDGTLEATLRPEPFFHRDVVAEIRKNRWLGKVDRIEVQNRKLRYECVWGKDALGIQRCFFALDAYDWIRMGDREFNEPRGCVGVYVRPDGRTPQGASITGIIQSPRYIEQPLNPFLD